MSQVKQSLAGVRRAEALEVARGVAADRNARRDARIEKIRNERVAQARGYVIDRCNIYHLRVE